MVFQKTTTLRFPQRNADRRGCDTKTPLEINCTKPIRRFPDIKNLKSAATPSVKRKKMAERRSRRPSSHGHHAAASSTASKSSPKLAGFTKWRSNPQSAARALDSASPHAVSAMIFTPRVSSPLRKAVAT